MKISVRTLRRAGACKEQVDLFLEYYGGKPVEVTEKECVKHAQEFNWDWAAAALLTGEAYGAYDAALKKAYGAYDAAIERARKEYNIRKARAFARAAALTGR